MVVAHRDLADLRAVVRAEVMMYGRMKDLVLGDNEDLLAN